jgi:two-component system response regulator AlgR
VDALAIAREEQPEIMLLDIRMPEMDGVEVASRLLEEQPSPAVIFCTAYDEYALEALRHQAIAYLLKPARERELERALAAAVRLNKAQLVALAPRMQGVRSWRAPATAASRPCRWQISAACWPRTSTCAPCAPQGELLLSESLKDLEAEFPHRFLRIHRNALVAPAHIRRLSRASDGGWLVELDGVDERPQVSRRHVAAIKAELTGQARGRE